MAMALLNGLPENYDSLISALDALGDNDQIFTFEFLSSRCEQEEQRQSLRHTQAIAKSETAALIASKSRKEDEMCIHCNKHRNSNKCYRKYPHLAPRNRPFRNRKALVSRTTRKDSDNDSEEVCLLSSSSSVDLDISSERKSDENFTEHKNTTYGSLGIQSTPWFLASEYSLTASDQSKSCESWILDSGCTSHMTFDRSSFTSYSSILPISVDFDAESKAQIIGTGCVDILVSINGKSRKVKFENVKHVPELRFQLISISAIAQRGMRTEFDDQGAR
eukprot:IDg7797t1